MGDGYVCQRGKNPAKDRILTKETVENMMQIVLSAIYILC